MPPKTVPATHTHGAKITCAFRLPSGEKGQLKADMTYDFGTDLSPLHKMMSNYVRQKFPEAKNILVSVPNASNSWELPK